MSSEEERVHLDQNQPKDSRVTFSNTAGTKRRKTTTEEPVQTTPMTSSPPASSPETGNDGVSSISEPASSIINQFSNVVRPFGYSNMECGYCKGSRASLVGKTPVDGSKSYSILAERLTPEAYEGFCYRGWRRSGIHLYKPSNFESCCPTLTIRCDTDRFRPTKSQSKILHKLKQLLLQPPTTRSFVPQKKPAPSWDSYLQGSTTALVLSQLQESTRQAIVESHLLPPDSNIPSIQYKVRPPSKVQETKRIIMVSSSICAQLAGKNKIPRDPLVDVVIAKLRQTRIESVVSIDPHTSSGQILVTLRLDEERDEEDALEHENNREPNDSKMSLDVAEDVTNEGSSRDKLAHWYQQTTGTPLRVHQRELRILTLPAHESALNPKVHELYIHYQHVVHQDPDPLQTKDEEDNIQNNPASPHDSNTTTNDNDNDDVNNNNDDDKDNAPEPTLMDPIKEIDNLDWGSHCPPQFEGQVKEMLQNYLAPHPKHVQQALLTSYFSFYQFLVESPFVSNTTNDNDTTMHHKEGSFHQQYWIGDVLIAVGVVDVLPNGLSSVYLYYHPGMSHSLVALGKLATLKEIEYTRDMLKKPYYYLGYYIESCPKMRYKADYHPSHLLCPVHYQWVDCDMAIPKLQSMTPRHVCALVGDPTVRDRGSDSITTSVPDVELAQIPMDIGAGFAVTLDMLQENGRLVARPILQEFFMEAGPDMSRKCLLKLA